MSKNNELEASIKEHVTKEMNAINVPKGLKEEMWMQVQSAHKKRKLTINVFPYIAAIACLIIFIPLVLSGLPTKMASGDLSGQSFAISTPDPNSSPDKLYSIMTIEFIDNETVSTARYGEGTYELNDDELILYYENDNEYVEIRFTLEESDKAGSEYLAEINEVIFEMEDYDKVSYYRNLANTFYHRSGVFFVKK
ncbi:hypothetical protein [Ornithinibacillus halotolerans]|uniref:Uncharacterized protein n=1 Tax=Ornithinibacillus halotolerans TaxID=1274357 RepID=A0A916W3U0_9BACI|nr:hypothetical protein [Ornithinibacillus halotolerans]GGA63661.1 hypothetical protein GCM10008025_04420 [Ornithinibacillus halotolerans]